jgi:4-amino-4-deoxy-L-arabinose transferase-like glycosyltransferase
VRRAALVLSPLIGLYVAAMLVIPTGEGWAGDEGVYVELARNLTRGFYRTGSGDGALNMCLPGWHTPDLWYGPGFPALLAPFVALGLPVSTIRLVGPVLLFLSVLLFYRLLRASVGPRSALAGAVAFGLFLPFYRYLPFLHSEFLALVLVVIAMLAITGLVRDGSLVAGAIAAVALAWIALTRVAYGWALAALALFWLIRWAAGRTQIARRLLVVHVLALVLCVPWLAYTYSVTKRPFLWSTSGSLSLYWMSAPEAVDRGDWHCANDVYQLSWLAPHRPFFVAHRNDSPTAQDRALERQALRNIRHHPVKYGKNLLANASRILFDAPYSQRPLTIKDVVAFVIPGALLVAALVLAGLRVARRRVRLPPETTAFALLALAGFAVSLPASAYVRMVVPIVPPLLWLSVIGLTRSDQPDQ